MGTIRTGEEVAALYRRHVGMVYQICIMLLKMCLARRTPPRRSFKR